MGLCACLGSNSGDALSEYIKGTKEPSNGLHQEVAAKGLNYTLTYEPGLFKYIKENRQEVRDFSNDQIVHRAEAYSQVYLELKIEIQSNKLKWIASAWQEESIKPNSPLAAMICGTDTLKPMGIHVVVGQGIQGTLVANLTFPQCPIIQDKNRFLIMDLSSDDRDFLTFEFDPTVIKSYSTLKQTP